MALSVTEDVKRSIKESIPEKFLLHDLQEGLKQCGNLTALEYRSKASYNAVEQLETRLMLIKYWIDGKEDRLSDDVETDLANLNKTSTMKKECQEIGDTIIKYCAQLESDCHTLQLKENLLFEKVNKIKAKSAKCNQLRQEKLGKVIDILGPNMPEQLCNLDEQMQLKVKNAQHIYKMSRSEVKSLKVKVSQLKVTCKQLLNEIQVKEMEYNTLKQNQDNKVANMNEDFAISEKLINVYESSDVTLEKCGKNFIQIKMASEIGESETLLLTLTFKPSDNGRILLDDVHVSNKNLYITDCVKNTKCFQEIPACLTSIRERWHYYLRMSKHLKDIQERLPVDWIQQENKLRVVIGKNANIICTFQLPSANQSCISLLDIRGGESEVKTDLLKMPSNPEASIQEWVEYLEQQFC